MSSSIWTRVARTALIRPRIGSGHVLGRSYVLLTARPTNNVLLRSLPLITRQQSSVAAMREKIAEVSASSSPVEATESEEELPHFDTLQGAIDGGILRSLTRGPFHLTTMSSVQAEVLPLLPELAEPYNPNQSPTSPRDLLVRAKTGTGKTLAFLIPAVQARLKALETHVKNVTADSGLKPTRSLLERTRREYARKHTGVVIISPTRELATQIGNEARKLVRHLEGTEVHLLVGGENKNRQLRGLRYGTHDIIVATPGRLRDILESAPEVADSVAHTQTLVLDEADTLLDMGFSPDILAIQKFMPESPQRQTFLFSATVSPAIRQVARASLAKEHRFINCVADDAPPTHAHIPQYHTVLPSADNHFSYILRLLAHDQLANLGKSKTIIFLPTTKMTQLVAELLREVKRDTLPAGSNTTIYELHSKRRMEARMNTSKAFRNDTSGASVLVTSDVSARGVDYPGVTRVVQIGVPSSGEQYIHRVGRTGRAGTEGRGDLILLPWERKFVSQELNGVPLKPLTVADHNTELLELAKSYDQDPKAFWGGEIPVIKSSNSYLRGRTLFRTTSLTPMLEDIPRRVSECVSQINEEAVSETFVSLLGYYVAQVQSLRLAKTQVLESLQDWAVQACGLPRPPTVSRTFLAKIGFGEEKKMDNVRKRGFMQPKKSTWAFRGEQKVREEFGRGRSGDRSFMRDDREKERARSFMRDDWARSEGVLKGRSSSYGGARGRMSRRRDGDLD
ncbi:DEAD-box ATP-dependent RNA helicase 26 [Leucoagaricus sp. SymC.cos]|nr:DEAD-box ATP-dependent RNA helicase 26 [Leucoagaricus sp. SymC.cos]